MEPGSIASFMAEIDGVGAVEIYAVVVGHDGDSVDLRTVLVLPLMDESPGVEIEERLRRIPACGDVLSVPGGAVRVVHQGELESGKKSRIVIVMKDGVLVQMSDQSTGNTRAIHTTVVDIGSEVGTESVSEVLISKWGLKPILRGEDQI